MLPLEGIRVLDLTMWWAGPTCTLALADLGAEVIKVESIQRIDGYRATFLQQRDDKFYERSGAYNYNNRNKYGITLDLTRPEGIALVKKLAAISDVLVDNYSPRVMENFGLTYSEMVKINPAIIMLSMPAFGLTGPWRDYVGFAYNIEQMAGSAQLTGYPDGGPLSQRMGSCDPFAGLHAAFAILAALEYRRRTGHGQYVDMSQVEVMTGVIAHAIMDWVFNQHIWPRRGNRHPLYAPQGCYRCQGDDRWVTVCVRCDEEWQALCRAIERPDLAGDPSLADAKGRHARHDELDAIIEAWTSQRDPREAMELLQAAGVPGGAVQDARDVLHDPHLNARGFFEQVERAYVGTHPYPGTPIRLSSTPARIRMPAPTLGQHNQRVLGDLLGLSAEEIAALEAQQIIGTEPQGR